MFDPDIVKQALGDNLWPLKPINQNYMTRLLCQVDYLLGMSRVEQYSFVKITHKKWLENESDLDDDEYELPILKYVTNKKTLLEHTKGPPLEEEGRTQWRRKRNQEHHPNWHQKKENMKITWIKDVVG
jgi:hypothetical protein